VIESGGAKSKKAVTIKSHHNVGGLPEQLGLKLLEPLRDLFKDEVRELGVALGLPAEMVYRHPFPGPGLGVRILGEVKKNMQTCCARLMLFSLKSYATPKMKLQAKPGINSPAKPLPYFYRLNLLASWAMAARMIMWLLYVPWSPAIS